MPSSDWAWLRNDRGQRRNSPFVPLGGRESAGVDRNPARSVAVRCLGDGDIPSWTFHEPVLECQRCQRGILVPCCRSLSTGFCGATEWNGVRGLEIVPGSRQCFIERVPEVLAPSYSSVEASLR